MIVMHRFNPYEDGSGKSWYDATSAVDCIRTVTPTTVLSWARNGFTPWGMPLEVLRLPLLRTDRHRPRSTRQYRLLLSEESVLMLKILLQERDRRNSGRFTKGELASLERRTRFYRVPGNSPAP
jgi:hypothetical protein